jgi:murein DD-endopeptidase MepM/ murein hydrolase activator NlpD
VALALVLAVGALVPIDAAAETPGLAEARQAAADILEEIDEVNARIGELDGEISALEADQERLSAARAELLDDVQAMAVDQYVQGQTDVDFDPDPDRRLRATALADAVGQGDYDTLERYRAIDAELAVTEAELDDRLAEQQAALTEVEDRQEALAVELARLEQLEVERLEAERLEAERQAREAQEAAERRAAQARADALADEQAARAEVQQALSDDTPTDDPVVVTMPPPPAPPPPPPGGGMLCPLPGSVYRDGYGDPRPGGRVHTGIDMVAPEGTPIVAPVSGTVVHGGDALGGNTFNLTGSDGRGYYGAHLSAYGASGSVSAGTVIGYVGNTGHSFGAHLHIQISVGGSTINPFPDLVAAGC